MEDILQLRSKACDALHEQAGNIEKHKSDDRMATSKKVIADAVAERLSAFVMQDDTGELARNIVKKGKSISGCVEEIMKSVTRDTVAISDIEVYTKALHYYLPEASIRCSFRCIIPQEVDDDIAFLGTGVEDEPELGGSAKILDLLAEEVDLE